MKRILVAYASKSGSTAEVAEAIGATFVEAGAAADVRKVQDVSDVRGYDAVILGSPIFKSQVLPEAVTFARKHLAGTDARPAAYFETGITMIEDTPENRAKAVSYLEQLCKVRQPVGLGLFAGKIDHEKLPAVWRFALSWIKEGLMADGDHRDWAAIRAWARSLASSLL